MAKLHFKTGTMNSGKSHDIIRCAYSYSEKGMVPLIYKPSLDTREGTDFCLIRSRAGSEVSAAWLDKEDKYLNKIFNDIRDHKGHVHVILIDECQFLTEEQVDTLQIICYTCNIPVICYGLKVDFQSKLFPGSKRLLEIADDIQELIGVCHCGKKAKQSARIKNEQIVRNGNQLEIGGNESYVSLCNECYLKGKIK